MRRDCRLDFAPFIWLPYQGAERSLGNQSMPQKHSGISPGSHCPAHDTLQAAQGANSGVKSDQKQK